MIDALLQIQVVFELDLLDILKQKCLFLMEEQFLELSDQVDLRIYVIYIYRKIVLKFLVA